MASYYGFDYGFVRYSVFFFLTLLGFSLTIMIGWSCIHIQTLFLFSYDKKERKYDTNLISFIDFWDESVEKKRLDSLNHVYNDEEQVL